MIKKTPKPALCPGCEEQVLEAQGNAAPQDCVEDAAGRPWHRGHALKALANHFRTPLSLIDATAAVSFEHDRETFNVPYSFHLREIVLLGNAEIEAVYVGQRAMTVAYMMPIRPQDLPGRAIVIDHDAPLGLNIMVRGFPKESLRYRLVGERRPEKARPRPSAKGVFAVGPLKCEELVVPGGISRISFMMPAAFRGDRVVADDWKDWEVVAVRVGADPGRAMAESVPLTGPSTTLLTYVTRVGEGVEYELRNAGKVARAFSGRVYGECFWG